MPRRNGIIIHPEELDATWPERLSDAKINVLGLHPVGGVNAHVSLEDAILRRHLPETEALFVRLNRCGIAVEYEAHAMGWLLPKTLFGIAPAFFRMNEEGLRIADKNLCASNGEALEYVGKRAEVLARLLDTGSDRYFFWLDDVSSGSCHCPECAKLSPSDQQLLVVNAMLRGIRRYNGAAKLSYLAYQDTIKVPERIEPAKGVFLEYAPFKRDHHKPMFDADCAENAAEAASVEGLLDFFGRRDSQVLEYWMDNSKFSGWKKPPKRFILDEAVMRRDVADYRARGFELITSFGCYLGSDYHALYGEPPVAAYGHILNGG
ncbi:MAG: DUF4838 domain-containing protein [Christensenellales bacterium]|jgi:hypothetical protein